MGEVPLRNPHKVFDLELVPPHSKQLLAELAEEQYHVHKEVQQCRAKFISVRKRNPALYHNIQNITLEVPDIVADTSQKSPRQCRKSLQNSVSSSQTKPPLQYEN